VIKSDNYEPSKSTSWKVLETALSHHKANKYSLFSLASSDAISSRDFFDRKSHFHTGNQSWLSYKYPLFLDQSEKSPDSGLVCVPDESKLRYSPSANQRPKACSARRDVTRVFYNRLYLALAYGCSFVHRDWTSGSRGTMVTLSMSTRYTT